MKEQLREHLQGLIRKQSTEIGYMNISKGIAKDIDESKGTFSFFRDGEDDFPDVSLNAFFESEGHFLVVPKEESAVVVGFADGNKDAFLLSASQIEKLLIIIGDFNISIDKSHFLSEIEDSSIKQTKDLIELKNGGSKIEIDSNTIKLNGGSLGGLVLLQGVLARLNNLESLFNSHTHTLTSLTSPTSPPLIPALPLTMQSDLENTDVKQ